MNDTPQIATSGKMARVAISAMMLLSISARAALAEEVDVGQLLTRAMARYETMQTYTCLLDKRVAKSGKLHQDLSIRVKFKKPTNYYFRWEEGMRKGREVIFAAGRHDGKIVAHPGGWFRFVTLRLNPEGRLAMKENRHSLKNSGLRKIMQVVGTDFHRAQQQGLDAIHYMGEERVDNRTTWVVQGQFPEGHGYYANRVILLIDQTLFLPIKVSIYDGVGTLVEEYLFHQLEIDVPFTDQDFDPANPGYDFVAKDRK